MTTKRGITLLLVLAIILYLSRKRSNALSSRMNHVAQYDSTYGLGVGDIPLEDLL